MAPDPAFPPGVIFASCWKISSGHFGFLRLTSSDSANRPGKPSKPYFDLDLWMRQARFAMDLLGTGEVGIIGHSVSAVLALKLAATNPRVRRVMTTGAMGGRFVANHDLELTWSVPRTRDDLRKAMQSLIYDHSLITDAVLDNRMTLLGSNGYAGYFGEMFAGDKQQFVDACVLDANELRGLKCEVTLVHGRDDKPIPAIENSVAIGALIPKADVVLLGHRHIAGKAVFRVEHN